jgi:hypothetical protein
VKKSHPAISRAKGARLAKAKNHSPHGAAPSGNTPTHDQAKTQQAETLEPQTPIQRRSLRSLLSLFHGSFRDVWFYVSAFLLVLTAYQKFRPELSIQIAQTSPNHPVATLFSISNNGVWTLTKVRTTCAIGTGGGWAYSGDNAVLDRPGGTISGNANIAVFPSGQVATKDCAPGFAGEPQNTGAARIEVIVQYNWFFDLFSGTEMRYFDMRRLNGQLILVPDLEPWRSGS